MVTIERYLRANEDTNKRRAKFWLMSGATVLGGGETIWVIYKEGLNIIHKLLRKKELKKGEKILVALSDEAGSKAKLTIKLITTSAMDLESEGDKYKYYHIIKGTKYDVVGYARVTEKFNSLLEKVLKKPFPSKNDKIYVSIYKVV